MPGELILLVDDEPNIVQLERMSLKREAFWVAAVGDGRSAFQSIEQTHPALSVFDLMLSQGCGLEMCHRLRERNHPNRLAQVLSILIDHALKFTPAGELGRSRFARPVDEYG